MPGAPARIAAPPAGWRLGPHRPALRVAALAVFVTAASLARLAAAASESSVGVRVIGLSLAANEAVPRLSISRTSVTTVTFLDADGTPWPIATLHASAAAPTATREPSHTHVATLRAEARQPAGNVVAFLEGLAEPVHLAASRDAPVVPRIRIRIARQRRGSDHPRPGCRAPRPGHGRGNRPRVPAGEPRRGG